MVYNLNNEIFGITGFLVGVIILLVLDLKVLHGKEHRIGLGEAAKWSVFWIGLACAFGVGYWLAAGHEKGLLWFTGYVVEKSLSVDNLFVFLVLLNFFRVPGHLHHKVLFWGIVGALVIRGTFIFAGTALIEQFHWILYPMGAFLMWTGLKIFNQWRDEDSEEKDIQQEGEELVHKNKLIQLLSGNKFLPVTAGYVGDNFFTVQNGVRMITPLFIVLVAIETTDILFAVDSIPAIMGITTDPFIVFTSNVAAILGLRALFFLVEAIIGKLPLLPPALAFALGFIGLKMLLPIVGIELPILLSVAIILGVILLAVLASLAQDVLAKKQPEAAASARWVTVRPQGKIVDGKWNSTTGDLVLQLAHNDHGKQAVTNCGFVLDLSANLQNAANKGAMGIGTSRYERLVARLAQTVATEDSDGQVLVMGAALGQDGKNSVDLGTFPLEELTKFHLNAAEMDAQLGTPVYILPAIQEAYNVLAGQPGVGLVKIVLLTDSVWDDFAEVKAWAKSAAQKMTAGKMLPTKIVLVDFSQEPLTELDELDNLDTGTVFDIFDAKHAPEIESNPDQIFSEVLTAGDNVVAYARITSADGRVLAEFTNGLPVRFSAKIPVGVTSVNLTLNDMSPFTVNLN